MNFQKNFLAGNLQNVKCIYMISYLYEHANTYKPPNFTEYKSVHVKQKK
jgi:hypothetical protein